MWLNYVQTMHYQWSPFMYYKFKQWFFRWVLTELLCAGLNPNICSVGGASLRQRSFSWLPGIVNKVFIKTCVSKPRESSQCWGVAVYKQHVSRVMISACCFTANSLPTCWFCGTVDIYLCRNIQRRDKFVRSLTLKVLVTTIDALGHF